MDAPSCYERAVRAERKSALQGSGLIRTVGPCAQRKVALLMPWAIATARDALSNDRCESTARFERPAKQALFFVIPVSSLVATFEQSENVAIAHLVGAACHAMRGVAFAAASICACARY